MLIMQFIDEKTGAHNVPRSDIRLHLGQIAITPDRVGVFVRGKLRDDHVVILTIDSIKEPQLPLLDGAGNGESGIDLVERPTFFILHRWNEIGGGKAIVIVPDPGIKREDPGRAFPIFRGNAAGFDIHSPQSIGADPRHQLPVRRLSDIEAVQDGESLSRLTTGNMWLRILIEYNS